MAINVCRALNLSVNPGFYVRDLRERHSFNGEA